MGDWLVNEGPKWLITTVWLLINITIFAYTYVSYQKDQDYFYLRLLVGDALCWARASAACLNFNCLLVLLPVCRNLISAIRGACFNCHRNIRRQLDRNVTYHKYIGYMICLMTAIHICAHCYDFEYLVYARSGSKAVQAVSNLPVSPNGTYVNPIRTLNTDPTREMFKTVAGISGAVITLCLILMVTSSTDIIRRSYFEVFWFTHHLFIVFYIGLVIHGIQSIIRHQTNTPVHDPEVCHTEHNNWGSNPKCPVPQFAGAPPKTWMWVIAPLLLYILERLVRFARSFQRVVVTKVIKHPSNVFELRMRKKGFFALPGQYVFLKCPSISRFEWHPFTLTMAPNEEFFSVHIRRVGDWTENLAKKCYVDDTDTQEAWKYPRLAVDGPFGTATEDYYRYEVAVLIGAGIGVTPFAAVLKEVWLRYCDEKSTMSLKKVHFYWLCPSMSSFEWFQDLLKSLEQQMTERGQHDFLATNIYLTRGWNDKQAKNIAAQHSSEFDPVTGLSEKTYYGRPQWDNVFTSLVQSHPGISVGVFFCGPKELSTQLHKLCNRYSDTNGTRFFYNKENF